MLTTGMLALSNATVGFVTVIRNVGPLISLPLEYLVLGHVEIDMPTFASLIGILAGVVLYVKSDVSFSLPGFAYMLINLIIAIVHRLIERQLLGIAPIDVSKTGLVLINNSLGFVWTLIPLFALREEDEWPVMSEKRPIDWIVLALSAVVGLAIGWAGINLQQYVSATSLLVLTNVNKVIVILIGILFLGDSASWASVLGAVVALGGGVCYGLARSRLSKNQPKGPDSAGAKGVVTEGLPGPGIAEAQEGKCLQCAIC